MCYRKIFRGSLFLISLGCILYSNIYAYTIQDRNLPGIDIIPRSEWLVDDDLLYRSSSPQSNQGGTETSLEAQRDAYLKNVFLQDYRLDALVSNINGRYLIWPRGYKHNKLSIIIHHTAIDASDVVTLQSGKEAVNRIFRAHTVLNKRGDIGYNFLIDPLGNIYEGRGGGEDVVGAHALYNNQNSLGIALLGNFEITEPTEAQLNALIQLSSALALHYHINPYSEIYTHHADSRAPYIRNSISESILGHRDTKNTACPGKNLYDKLDMIKKSVASYLTSTNSLASKKQVRRIIDLPQNYTLQQATGNKLIVPIAHSDNIIRCISMASNVQLSCKQEDHQTLSLTISKKDPLLPSATDIPINITTQGLAPNLKTVVHVIRDTDQQLRFEQAKKTYIERYGLPPQPPLTNKIVHPIPLSEISSLAHKEVKVLLYDASTSLNQWDLFCQQCEVVDGSGNYYTDTSFTISVINDKLYYTSSSHSGQTFIESIAITPKQKDRASFILNYPRVSYVGIAWNNFYGTLTIDRQPIKILQNNEISTQYVLTNTLPLDLYMRGIVEAPDTEPFEKIKVMALIAKNYMLFYLDENHRHPNIPRGANYNAVDDARIFQKYVGAGVDQTLTKRIQALDATSGEVVVFNNNLAFLPYFSCSAGFTWSALEKRGRQDTPYLSSVYDPASCEDFDGHGVGLSGRGAALMATQGSSYRDIIQHFYPGTTIVHY